MKRGLSVDRERGNTGRVSLAAVRVVEIDAVDVGIGREAVRV